MWGFTLFINESFINKVAKFQTDFRYQVFINKATKNF